MKNTKKLVGIITFVAVIGLFFALTFTSCDDGRNDPYYYDGGGGSSYLSGTYGYTSTGNLTITFRTNGTFTGNYSSSQVNGTYQVRGDSITLSQRYYGYNWTIINSSTIMDEDGDYWRRR